MRRVLAALVAAAVLVVAYVVVDDVARHRAESSLATRIEMAVPGSAASVRIPSSLFLARLGAQGRVDRLTATVTGVKVGAVPVGPVDVDVRGVRLSRGDLLSGKVTIQGVDSVALAATVTQAAIDHGTGLPLSIGSGTVGFGPLQVPATVSVTGGALHVSVAGLPAVSFDVLPPSLLPCPLEVAFTPGVVLLSCRARQIPGALAAG